MTLKLRLILPIVGLLVCNTSACAEKLVIIDPVEAADNTDFGIQGEYAGVIGVDGDQRIGLQVAAYGEGAFIGMVYFGGLPGDGWMSVEDGLKVGLEGRRRGEELLLRGGEGLVFRWEGNRFVFLGEEGESLAELEKVVRTSPTLGMEPPAGALVLFDGSDVEKWDGKTRMTDGGLLMEGATTADKYGDMRLHMEFKLGFMPGHRNQNRSNSGVYIQRRYEVQILDSFALPAKFDGSAALYREKAADVNMSFPPMTWQTYDIEFCAPRFDEDGNKTDNARISVYHNGVLVQDKVELEKGTGAGGEREELLREVLYLQDHGGDPVRFRNIWLVEECE